LENVQLYQQLREQDRRKDEFLATLAHELRNPLAPVRTGLELLKRGGDETQKSRTHQMMERQLVHLVRMVDDLLDVSRITLGKVALQRQRVEFRTVLNSALETTRGLIESRGHEVAVRMPQQELPLDADPTRLSQVVSNLLNNAAKYTPPGGRILVAVDTAGDELVLRISDSGIGIPKDMLNRVFDMFTQVGRTVEHAQGGLGIGLTLVRRLTELHAGSIEALSEGVGRGSTFVVRLPLAAPLHDAKGDAADPVSETASDGIRVLIVDDNVDAAESLSMLLQINGSETMSAHTGESALDRAVAFKPDLILLDIGLPDLSGYEVAQRLRADPRTASTMLVALTGWGSDEYRKRATEVGFDRHLVKPVDFDELNAVLADAQALSARRRH
jgi:CheY-like chemotaxis protein